MGNLPSVLPRLHRSCKHPPNGCCHDQLSIFRAFYGPTVRSCRLQQWRSRCTPRRGRHARHLQSLLCLLRWPLHRSKRRCSSLRGLGQLPRSCRWCAVYKRYRLHRRGLRDRVRSGKNPVRWTLHRSANRRELLRGRRGLYGGKRGRGLSPEQRSLRCNDGRCLPRRSVPK